MTEEYELATFDRHNLNFDNIALGRLPTNVTTDPSVKPLRELAYLPKGVMDPHEVPPSDVRVGKLPEEVYDWMKPELNDIKNPTVETNK
jgi:NAD(P)H-quinone oxidoreductase subunit I